LTRVLLKLSCAPSLQIYGSIAFISNVKGLDLIYDNGCESVKIVIVTYTRYVTSLVLIFLEILNGKLQQALNISFSSSWICNKKWWWIFFICSKMWNGNGIPEGKIQRDLCFIENVCLKQGSQTQIDPRAHSKEKVLRGPKFKGENAYAGPQTTRKALKIS
jgi:hypothetical protein